MLTRPQQQFTGFNPRSDTFRPQTPSGFALVHFRIHIQCGKQRIKRAGGGMHHKGIIHLPERDITRLTFDMFIFFVDLRRLGEPGHLFVNRLGYQNAGVVFIQFQQHR